MKLSNAPPEHPLPSLEGMRELRRELKRLCCTGVYRDSEINVVIDACYLMMCIAVPWTENWYKSMPGGEKDDE